MIILFCLIVWAVVIGIILARMTQRLAAKAVQEVPQAGALEPLADGTQIHWVEWGAEHRGKQPTIVLVHGIGAQMQTFTAPLVERLAQTHHVVAIDRPGSGYSVRPRELSGSFEDQANAIAEFIRAAELGACIMVGHSLGGGIIQRQWVDHRDTIAALALISPVSQPMRLPPAVFRMLLIPTLFLRRFLSETIAVPISRALHPSSLKVIFAPETVDPETYFSAQGGGGWLGKRPRAIECFSEDALAAGPSLSALAEDLPDLAAQGPIGGIMFGENDHVLPEPVHGQRLAKRLPSLDYRTLPNSGHMWFLKQPLVAADFILDQAAKVAGRA